MAQQMATLSSADAAQLSAGVEILGVDDAACHLVHNSLEAGSTHVQLQLDPSTASLVCLDNGVGISAFDARKYLCRFRCTSKPSGRGVGLASIAQVANVDITTRPKGCFTSYIAKFRDGKLAVFQACSPADGLTACGTRVRVEHLLHNLPARRKHMLSSPGLQKQNVRSRIAALAIAYTKPSIRAVASDSYEPLVDAQQSRDVVSTLADLQCAEIAHQMVPIEESTTEVTLDGYIAKYPFGSPAQTCQYTFMNRRTVNIQCVHDLLARWFTTLAQRDGKRSPASAPTNLYPAYVIFVHSSSEEKDVIERTCSFLLKKAIVHTAWKDSVSFVQTQRHQGGEQRHKRVQAFKRLKPCDERRQLSMQSQVPARSVPLQTNRKSKEMPIQNAINEHCKWRFGSQTSAYKRKRVEQMLPQIADLPPEIKKAEDLTMPQELSACYPQQCKALAQIDKKVLIASAANVLVAMDQHACDERVQLERMWKEYRASSSIKQKPLQAPQRLLLEPLEAEVLQQMEKSNARTLCLYWRTKSLAPHGRLVEISAIPVVFGTEFGTEVLVEHLADIYERGMQVAERSPKVIAKLLSQKACAEAIKFNDELSPARQEELCSQLGQCKLPNYCAHGRSTMAPLVDLNEMHAKHKRSVCAHYDHVPSLERALQQVSDVSP